MTASSTLKLRRLYTAQSPFVRNSSRDDDNLRESRGANGKLALVARGGGGNAEGREERRKETEKRCERGKFSNTAECSSVLQKPDLKEGRKSLLDAKRCEGMAL